MLLQLCSMPSHWSLFLVCSLPVLFIFVLGHHSVSPFSINFQMLLGSLLFGLSFKCAASSKTLLRKEFPSRMRQKRKYYPSGTARNHCCSVCFNSADPQKCMWNFSDFFCYLHSCSGSSLRLVTVALWVVKPNVSLARLCKLQREWRNSVHLIMLLRLNICI